jgi:hypothetical protein
MLGIFGRVGLRVVDPLCGKFRLLHPERMLDRGRTAPTQAYMDANLFFSHELFLSLDLIFGIPLEKRFIFL